MVFRRSRIRSQSPTKRSLIYTAALTLILGPLAVVGGNSAINLVQDNGSGPVDAALKSVSLADSASVLVDDAAIATQSIADELHPNRGVVKEITSDTEFSQFALTWHGPADVASFVRAQRADGTWSEWYDAEPQYPDNNKGNGVNGTELLYVEPTKRVQISTHGLNIFGPDTKPEDIKGAEGVDLSKLKLGEGSEKPEDSAKKAVDAAEKAAEKTTESINQGSSAALDDAANKATKIAPKDPNTAAGKWTDIEPVANESSMDQVNAVLIDGNAAASAIDPIVDAKNATGMPKVITRAGWGANENNRCMGPDYNNKLVAATVHHTAGSNNYSEAQSAGIVRGIYAYHAQTLGWCDIGYNALVDKYGNIFEGRYGGLDKNVEGAHAGGFNTGTFGISMMGDYSTVSPSQATINAVGNMIGWRLHVAGIDPKGNTTLTSGGTSYSKYAYGRKVNLPNIFAHRDVGNTTCPGNSGYAQMDNIRNIAEKKYKSLEGGAVENNSPTGEATLQVPGAEAKPTSSAPTSTKPSSTSSSSAMPTTTNTTKPNSSQSSSSSASATKSSSAKPSTSSAAPAAEPSSVATTPSDSGANTGARSMLASALGLLGAPGLGATADAIFDAVGQSAGQGPSIADLPVLVDKILKIDQQNDLAAEWRTVTKNFGSVLGYALSGIQQGSTVSNKSGVADQLSYVKFDNGVITESKTTGTNAVWGKIADEWAKQGFEVGKLGAPTSTQTVQGNVEKAEFQGGTITYDKSTDKVAVEYK